MKKKPIRFVKSNYILLLGLAVLAAWCWREIPGRGFAFGYYGSGYAAISAAAVVGAVLQACLNHNIFTRNRFQLRRGKNPCQWKNSLGSFTWTKSPRANGICMTAVGLCWMLLVWVCDILAGIPYLALSFVYGTVMLYAEIGIIGLAKLQFALQMVPYAYGFLHFISAFLLTKAVLGFLLEPAPRKAVAPEAVQA